MGFEFPALRWLLRCLIARLNECQSVRGTAPFALKRPALAGHFFARYCPSNATELFSMCSRIPGQIEPVFS
jgi:hypothetical protein